MNPLATTYLIAKGYINVLHNNQVERETSGKVRDHVRLSHKAKTMQCAVHIIQNKYKTEEEQYQSTAIDAELLSNQNRVIPELG